MQGVVHLVRVLYFFKIPDFQILFINIEKQMVLCKVLPKRFHLNGHTIGFHPQTQKLELNYMYL